MSSTGRKRKDTDDETTEREKDNHYPTPAPCTRALIEHLGFSVVGLNVLECSAGDGAMVDVLADAGAHVDAVELNEDRAEIIRKSGKAHDVITGDFLHPETRARLSRIAGAIAVDVDPKDYIASVAAGRFASKPYDLVASNPPYGIPAVKGVSKYVDLARKFVETSLKLAPTVAMLLRVNWSGSEARYDFHRAHPADLKVMTPRTSFVKKGNDSAEYAWWIWREGMTIGTWEVIRVDYPKREPKPKPERKRARKAAADV